MQQSGTNCFLQTGRISRPLRPAHAKGRGPRSPAWADRVACTGWEESFQQGHLDISTKCGQKLLFLALKASF
jgi:hypothetical protein